MEFASITQFGGALAALVPLLLIFGFAVVIWRTDSFHTLLRRVWLLVHGNQEISDPQIRAFVDEQTSLISFRMFSGVRAASLEQAHQLMHWAKFHRIDLRQVGACGEYFDTELRQVRKHKLPCRPLVYGQLALFLILLFSTAGLAWLAVIPQVPLTFKPTQRTFFATEAAAQTLWSVPFFFNNHRLQKDDCEQPVAANAARTGFTEEEAKGLCKAITADEWPQYMKSQLTDKRWALLICVLFFGWLSYWSYLALNKVVNAKALDAIGLALALPVEQTQMELF